MKNAISLTFAILVSAATAVPWNVEGRETRGGGSDAEAFRYYSAVPVSRGEVYYSARMSVNDRRRGESQDSGDYYEGANRPN